VDARLPPLEAGKIVGIYDGTLLWSRFWKGTGDTVMALTDTHVRNAKPKAQAYKLRALLAQGADPSLAKKAKRRAALHVGTVGGMMPPSASARAA
jgi:hypothetical protein